MGARRLTQEQRRDWLRLICSENVGPATFRQLINTFGGAAQALDALPGLSARGGLKRPIKIYSQDDAERALARADALGASFIALGEGGYPRLLRFIDTAPPLLCVKGDTAVFEAPPVAIVGARNASALGRKFTRQIASDLASVGITVVSGMARGIDTAAHQASLEHGTVAVLAGGIDNIYPPENEQLYFDIAGCGALVSEMVPGVKPQARHFPRRNRLISGMSYGVVVIEAARRSGTLITARLALEQNREVFAVPGFPADPRAEGTNRLIRQGAVLTRSAKDVLEVLTPLFDRPLPEPDDLFEPADDDTPLPVGADSGDMPQDARELLRSLLGPSPIEIDDLIRESGLSPSVVQTLLLELELAGRLERHGQQRVSLL